MVAHAYLCHCNWLILHTWLMLSNWLDFNWAEHACNGMRFNGNFSCSNLMWTREVFKFSFFVLWICLEFYFENTEKLASSLIWFKNWRIVVVIHRPGTQFFILRLVVMLCGFCVVSAWVLVFPFSAFFIGCGLTDSRNSCYFYRRCLGATLTAVLRLWSHPTRFPANNCGRALTGEVSE